MNCHNNINLTGGKIMTQEQCYEAWKLQISDLTQKAAYAIIAKHAETLEVPVTWSKEGSNFKAEFPYIPGDVAYFIVNSDGIIIHYNQRIAQCYLPLNIKAGIKELFPTWTAFGLNSSPVLEVHQIVDNPLLLVVGNIFYPGEGITVQYLITWDDPENMTTERLITTEGYQHPTTLVNQNGVVL